MRVHYYCCRYFYVKMQRLKNEKLSKRTAHNCCNSSKWSYCLQLVVVLKTEMFVSEMCYKSSIITWLFRHHALIDTSKMQMQVHSHVIDCHC